MNDLHQRVLRLHKALIGAERTRYERANGPLESPYQLLGLLSNDPSFAWLRPLTLYIVQLEERMDGKEPMTAAETDALRAALRVLIAPDEPAPGFNTTYRQVLCDEPEIMRLHDDLMRTLGPDSTSPDTESTPG